MTAKSGTSFERSAKWRAQSRMTVRIVPSTGFAIAPKARRFEIRVQRLAGLGCLIAFIWVALCVLQINYVIEWIYANAIPSVWLSSVIGFFLAFVPVIGNVLAFLGATAAGWPVWVAALIFFAAPAATLISGWTRWRRRGR